MTTPERTSAVVSEAIAIHTADPSLLEGAVLVGVPGEDAVELLETLAPSIRKAIVFDTDGRVRTFDITAGKIIGEATLGDLKTKDSKYSLDAYIELAQFVVNSKLPLAKAVLCIGDGVREKFEAIVNPLEDLLFAQSARFVAFWQQAHRLTTEFFLILADFLAANGEPFHALKLYYLLRPRVDNKFLAARIAKGWMELNCPGPLGEWVDRLDETAINKDELRKELAASLKQEADARALIFGQNMKALERLHPHVFRKLQTFQPQKKMLTAFLPEVPYLVRVGGATQRGIYPIAFVLEENRISQENNLANPKVFRDAISTDPLRKSSSILVGTLKRYDSLLGLLTNPPAGGAEQSIYVVEEDLDFVHHWLSTIDMVNLFEEKRIGWFIGPSANEELVAYFSQNPGKAKPTFSVHGKRALVSRFEF